tara:strand:- start:212 stop:349 length:138 start_codon:yes stop_codon:yes gene_type:complete
MRQGAFIAMRVGADCSEFTNQLLLFLYVLLSLMGNRPSPHYQQAI